jgi:hypothetical protein
MNKLHYMFRFPVTTTTRAYIVNEQHRCVLTKQQQQQFRV